MPDESFRDILILTGPTGSGKSALSLEIAERLDAEIVSMDSMAVYRGMDIGTAKPTPADRQRVAHHVIDVLDPWESASVAWWLGQASAAVRDIQRRGKRALLVGGTPFYLKALLFGLFEGPTGNADIRQRLTEEIDRLGSAVLHERLAGVDRMAAARIHPRDARRIIRALEVWELTGKPISAWQQEWADATATSNGASAVSHWPRASGRCVWLDLPRQEIYDRINRRVDAMFAAGLVEEVRRLQQLPQPLSREAAQALGYKEIFALIDGNKTLAETIEEVKLRSRQFAKRQVTWFRHLPGCLPRAGDLTATLWSGRME
jgi:tRNA dimethylallyltransferase